MRILVTIAALIVGLFAWIALQSRPPRPNASVTFLTYTNSPSSGRMALFAITNLGASSVVRGTPYSCQIASATGWIYTSSGGFPRSTKLSPNTSEILPVVPPTNRVPWKVSILFMHDVGRIGLVKAMGTFVLWRIGLPERYGYGVMRYEINSDVVDESQTTNPKTNLH